MPKYLTVEEVALSRIVTIIENWENGLGNCQITCDKISGIVEAYKRGLIRPLLKGTKP